MKKMLTLLLIGMITLAPALVAAQTGGGSGSSSGAAGSSSGAGGSGTSKGGSTGATGSGSSSGSMSAPSSSGTAPSASPPGSSSDSSLSKITNQADCKAAGGDWQASTGMCRAKTK